MHIPFKKIVTAACLVLITVSAQAALYKYTDEEGNVVYSQSPPESGEAKEIKPPPPPPEPPENEEELSPEQQKIREQFKTNCENAKNNLEIYTNTKEILVDGKIIVLSEEERTKRIKDAKSNIETFCK